VTVRQEKVVAAFVSATILPWAFITLARAGEAHQQVAPGWVFTALDRAVPVVPVAIWPYVSWYLAPAVVLLSERVTFRRVWLAELLSFGICAFGYVMLPIALPRPDIDDVDGGASIVVLSHLYRLDPPVNVFPSYHAAVATIIALLVRPANRGLGRALLVWMAIICASCVLTKQHVVIDVLAGAIVGGFATVVAVKLVDRRSEVLVERRFVQPKGAAA
jgi:membrane-associated phospholipid phosphatase